MPTGKKMKFIINTISYIKATGSFLINQDTSSSMWLNSNFIKRIYGNLGLATNTSFQLLKGCTIQCYQLNVTEEMLAEAQAAGLEGYTAPSNIGKKNDITWTTPGMKYFDHSVGANSVALDNAIIASGVTFDSSWADEAPASSLRTTVVEEPTVEHVEEEVDLNNEAGVEEVEGEEVEGEEELPL